jgi:competence protein ComEA
MDAGRTLPGAPAPSPPPSLLVTSAPAEAPLPPPAPVPGDAGRTPPSLLLPPAPEDTPTPPAWPPAAQWSAAALLTLALGLLGWHTYTAHRWAARPTTLEPGAVEIEPLDLNRADTAQLVQIPGLGAGLAQRIDEYRRQHGGFRSVEELRQVRGVGPALLEQLRPFLTVEPDSDEGPSPPPRVARAAAPDGPARPARPSGKKPPLTGVVNVNTASAEELRRLPGIGPKLSERILEARADRPFRSVDELRRVRGIGAKTLERLRPHVTVEDRRR